MYKPENLNQPSSSHVKRTYQNPDFYKKNLAKQILKRLAIDQAKEEKQFQINEKDKLKVIDYNRHNTLNTASCNNVTSNVTSNLKNGMLGKSVETINKSTHSECVEAVDNETVGSKAPYKSILKKSKIRKRKKSNLSSEEFASKIFITSENAETVVETTKISEKLNNLILTSSKNNVVPDQSFIEDDQQHITPSPSSCNELKEPTNANGVILRKNPKEQGSSSLPFYEDNDETQENNSAMNDEINTSQRLTKNATVESIDVTSENYETQSSDQDESEESLDGTTLAETCVSSEACEERFGEFKYITIDSQQSVLFLYPDTRVYFFGLMSAEVLIGTVEILGYSLQPSKIVELYSPRGSSFLYLETKNAEKTVVNQNQKIFTNVNLPKDILQMIETLTPGSAVVLCKKLELSKITFLEKYVSQYIFPKIDDSIDCIYKNTTSDWNVLKTCNDWDTIARNFHLDSRLLICGGKSVGKSYLLRYLINKTLMKHQKVLVIDLDPGQSEFTVPGCISVSIVDEPVFGPNYTHLRKPYRSIFVPEVNISFFFKFYIEAVKNLIQSCKDLDEMPTLINFMGHTRSLGFNILAAVVVVVQPTTIVEIKDKTKSLNYQEQIEHSTIEAAAANLVDKIDYLPVFTYYSVDSLANCKKGWHLQPRQIREMSVLCYFGDMLENCDSSLCHRNVPVYQVNMLKIKFICNFKSVNPAVVNGLCVALCNLLQAPNIYTCHGWGIIRAIDDEQKLCYVITPVPLDILETIDFYVLGAISLPPEIYMMSSHCGGLIPYVATNINEDFGNIPKRSHLSAKSKTAEC